MSNGYSDMAKEKLEQIRRENLAYVEPLSHKYDGSVNFDTSITVSPKVIEADLLKISFYHFFARGDIS